MDAQPQSQALKASTSRRASVVVVRAADDKVVVIGLAADSGMLVLILVGSMFIHTNHRQAAASPPSCVASPRCLAATPSPLQVVITPCHTPLCHQVAQPYCWSCTPRPCTGGNPDSNTLISDMTTVICLDDYHCLDRNGRKEKGVTALAPEAQDFDLMYEQVKALKEGKAVQKPIYNHVTGLLDPAEEIQAPKVCWYWQVGQWDVHLCSISALV